MSEDQDRQVKQGFMMYDFVKKVLLDAGREIVAARVRPFTPGGLCGKVTK